MKCDSYEIFFRNFSNRTKFDIVMSLKNKPMSVMELSKALHEEQSKVSHSLTSLAKCGILSVKQQGKQRIYSLNKETVMPILELVQKHVEKHCTGKCKVAKR
jgi:DNA-binding transcriptional ArsR family regulator